MTFLLLYGRSSVPNVSLDTCMGVKFEFCATSQKDPPVPAANSNYIPVDEWEWGVSTGRGPQS
jgi:hypothetical protein